MTVRTDTAQMPSMEGHRKVRLFDLHVTPRTAEQVVDEIDAACINGRTLVIGNVNAHGLYMLETNAVFRRYTKNADLCLIDGWPVLRLTKGRLPGKYRIGSTDWLDVLAERRHRSIVAIGGTPESSELAERNMRARGLDWRGFPGFDLDENEPHIVAAIAASDIVMVGMGMPAQEQWILDNERLLRGKVVANVGGCFDYYAGTQSLAPRWMGPIGLEWVYRLARNPKRLASRYLVEPLKLAELVVRRKLGLKDS